MMMTSWTDDAWADYLWWQGQDKKTLKRINVLILDIQRDPFTGIGKPEPLRFELAGAWSRRIDRANRLVYSADERGIIVYSARDHYSR